MRRFFVVSLLMVSVFSSCAIANGPKGKLIYCSYASVGAGAIGTEYCELIADPGTDPKVVVVIDADCHFADERRCEYPVDAAVVDSLQQKLAAIKVWKLDGYSYEEPITGGYAHRIHVEYDSGEKITARWYGHGVKDAVVNAYGIIAKFLSPWRDKLDADQPQKLR